MSELRSGDGQSFGASPAPDPANPTGGGSAKFRAGLEVTLPAELVTAGDALLLTQDGEVTLDRIAHLGVPDLGEWCQIYLCDANRRIRCVAAAHADPAKEALLRCLKQSYPLDQHADLPLSRAFRTGQVVHVAEVSGDLLARVAPDAEHRSTWRDLSPSSLLIVPMRVRDQTVGVLLLARGGELKSFDARDRERADELARRVAVALENALLREKARAAIALRDNFLAIAAHELKTPVTSLRGFAQLLLHQYRREQLPDPAHLRRAIETIDRQSKRLAILINELFDLTQLDDGELTLTPELTDIVALVNGVVDTLRVGLVRHTLNVQVSAAVQAVVDPLRLEIVVTNLVENAIKYSPSGGPIDVEIGLANSETVQLVVRDHGIGIPAEHRSRVFERFYQVQPDPNLGGLGLGLYIAQQIVELHGGSLAVESPPDGGTRFVVTFPRQRLSAHHLRSPG